MADPLEEAIIDLPFSVGEEDWSAEHSLRVQGAAMAQRNCIRVNRAIDTMMTLAVRNHYRLEVYKQVSNLVRFSGQVLFALQTYDIASTAQEKEEALAILQQYVEDFPKIRAELEEVYGRTRILHKPEGYILDQDHHRHLANQSINFDWQFWAEIYFLEKLEKQLNTLQK